MPARTLNASEAARMLDISLATLYSYVSRGLIASEPDPDDSRQRRYAVADVETLLNRRSARKNPETAIQDTLRWGMPLLDSALTLIEDGHVYYRGIDAVELAKSHTLKDVAALLWTGELNHNCLFVPENRLHVDLPALPDQPPLTRMQITLALAVNRDLRAYDLRAEQVPNTGARILQLLADTVTPTHADTGSIAAQLAAVWIPENPQGTDLLNMAMVLCADHELNASSFTARVVASAEATPYAVVSAGLAALSGIKHGGMTHRVAALLREIQITGGAQQVMSGRLQRGEAIPGFGHRLYPEGDPRAAALIERVLDHASAQDAAFIRDIVAAGRAILDDAPTVDFGLCALAYVLRLPDDSPLTLFTLGRIVGWIAHAIEQYATPGLIRPRARYVGARV